MFSYMQNRYLTLPIFPRKIIFFPLFAFFSIFSSDCTAQKVRVQLKTQQKETQLSLIRDTLFKNQNALDLYIKDISKRLNKEGFINHQITLEKTNDSVYSYETKEGVQLNFAHLTFSRTNDLPEHISNQQLIVPFSKLDNNIKLLYNYYEDQGYTFTEITPTKISQSNDTLYTNIEIKTTKKRSIDKVVVKGYKNFPQKFIDQHFGLSNKEIYKKSTLEKISQDLKTLPFVTETRKPEVLFTKDSTHIYVYLQKQQSNKFDGLIGFTNGENGKLRFNGYLDVALNNSFNKGEHLSFYWSNNGNQQENFKLKAATPYIFNSPISPEIKFEIYKQDSSFINTDFNASINYALNTNNAIGFNFLLKNSTNLIEDNTLNIETYKKRLYGTQYEYTQPKKTNTYFQISAKASAGNKTTETNTEAQYYTYLDIILKERLSKRSRIYIHNRTENITGQNLTLNELFQIGGANTIRGFYEQSIFTSSYNFTNLEYQLLTSLESYLYTLTDFGITKNPINSINDRNYSFGIGYAYKTKGGFINFNYAFGKTNKAPFNFNQGIFHIKLTTEF